MLLAVLMGVAAGLGGLYLSYYANIAAGAAITGMLVAAYLLARLSSIVQQRG